MTPRATLMPGSRIAVGDAAGRARAQRFWNVSTMSTCLWLVALLVFSVATSAFSDLTLAALVAGLGATTLAVIGRFGDPVQGATPFKLVFLGQAAYALVVVGSAEFVRPMGIPFRPPIVDESATLAAGLHSLFAVTLGLVARVPPLRTRPDRARVEASPRTRQVGWIAIATGAAALSLRFNSPGDLITYWSGAPVPEPSAAVLLFSNLFRPLLPIGMFLLAVHRRARQGRTPWLLLSTIALVTVLVLGTYSFNRAAIVTPFIALALLNGLAGRPLRWLRVLLLGSVLIAVAIVSGVLRSTLFNYGRATLDVASWSETIWTQVQLYGQSPHFTAEVVERGDAYSWRSLLASITSPIPGIPDSLRATSSTAIYNEQIYGHLPVRDQIIPTWAELWAVADIPALLAGAVALGWLLRVLTSRAAEHVNELTRYGYALAATWISVSPFYSFSAIVQSTLYFVLPVLLVGMLFSGERPATSAEPAIEDSVRHR